MIAAPPKTELSDFVGMWEMRFMRVIASFFDRELDINEGSRIGAFSDDSCVTVIVDVGREYPPRSGYFECQITAAYDYRGTDSDDTVSKTFGQLLEAVGNGRNGEEPLRDRLSEGRLKLIGGIDGVRYDGAISDDPEAKIKEYNFTAYLGLMAED